MDVALVGCGAVGRKRAAALPPGMRLVVACDADPGRAHALAAAHPGATPLTDWQEAIAFRGVHAVLVATTHRWLAPVTRAAIEAGKPVLVEKPAARSLAEAEELHDAAVRTGVPVRVGFNHRAHPALAKARALAAEGALGPLLFVRGRYGHGGRLGYEKEWRADRETSGGGELVDQGMHLVDLARWFLGDLGVAGARTATFFWKTEVDDNAFLHLETPAGQVAWLHASCTEWRNLFSFEVTGALGKLEVTGLGGSYGVERVTFHRMLPKMGPPETTTWEFPGEDRSWAVELEEFQRTLADGVARGPSLADAAAAWRVVDAAYRRERR